MSCSHDDSATWTLILRAEHKDVTLLARKTQARDAKTAAQERLSDAHHRPDSAVATTLSLTPRTPGTWRAIDSTASRCKLVVT